MKAILQKFLNWALQQRFYALVLTAVFGAALSGGAIFIMPLIFCELVAELNRFFTSLYVILLGLPTLTMLWFFRTHDTREQIVKSEESTNANILFGAQKMFDGDARSKAAGLKILMRLREQGFHQSTIDSMTRYADLTKAYLSSWDLRGLNLRDACLRQTRLDDADLRNVDMSLATLEGTNFEKAKLQGAKFDKRKSFPQWEINFEGAEYDDETTFPIDFNPKKYGMVYTGAGKEKP